MCEQNAGQINWAHKFQLFGAKDRGLDCGGQLAVLRPYGTLNPRFSRQHDTAPDIQLRRISFLYDLFCTD